MTKTSIKKTKLMKKSNVSRLRLEELEKARDRGE